MCGVDVYENLLVSDGKNKQLKVYCSEERTWQVVPLKFESEKPWDALVDEKNIWVLIESDPFQILKISKKM